MYGNPFIGDEAALRMLCEFCLPRGACQIDRIDRTGAESTPGVHAVISAKDIPGENMIGHIVHDEPLFH